MKVNDLLFELIDKKSGLAYLERIRTVNGYKQFVILYSNNKYSTIKDEVINVVKEKNIDIFSNFTFFSVGDNGEENHFKTAIDVILCRWDELNAIRGRYMFENAKLEHALREKLKMNVKNDQYIQTILGKEYKLRGLPKFLDSINLISSGTSLLIFFLSLN